ncbi:hypothetical protein [Stenotrophomonas sp. 57]|uniref:hypothetical protein n=1 Tax=Stenotrophomonas sp. 57 TaxID=3051119 RepID=UPI00256EB152|nr:hypothetical protein [Stenotrophomonas sp. 57]
MSGRARLALNFREVAVRRHDVLVLAEDTLALLRQRSRGFLALICLMPKALASEVAFVLPNALFKFLHAHPHCVPSPLDVPLLPRLCASPRFTFHRSRASASVRRRTR